MKRTVVVVLFAFVASAPIASAQSRNDGAPNAAETAPSEEERREALAAQYYAVGAAAFDEGEFERAFVSFRDSFELSGHPTLLYNLGLTLDRLQRLDEAKAYYERYLAEHPRPTSPGAVRARIEIISRALAERTTPPTDTLDAPGDDPETTEHTTSERTPTEPQETAVESAAAPETPRRSVPTGAVVAWIAAGVGLATFGAAGTYAVVRQRDLDSSCAPGCSPSDVDGARTAARVADVGLGVLAVGAIVGTVWWLVGDDDDEEPAVTLTPAASRHGLGAQVVGRF